MVQKSTLSIGHIKNNHDASLLHSKLFPKFKGLLLTDLKASHIQDWKLWKAEMGTGPRTVNIVLQAMRVAIRQAVLRDELPSDPFRSVKAAVDHPKEKGILTLDEAARLEMPSKDAKRIHQDQYR